MSYSGTTEPSEEDDLVEILNYENGAKAILYWCPGCETHHHLSLRKDIQPPGQTNDASWQFNGDKKLPSIIPSVNRIGICHHYVTKGKIWYLKDSTHQFSGQTIPMEKCRT